MITLKRFAFLFVLLKIYEFVFADLNLFVLMHKIIELNFFEKSMRRKRYRFRSFTNAAMSNTFIEKNVETKFDSNLKDNAEEDDENVIQSTFCRKKDKQSDCFYVNVKHEFIKCMKRSFASEVNMRNTTDCLKVIYYFFNISQINDFRHVCFRHIRNVTFHLKLSINVFDFNVDFFRNCLKQSWKKRISLKLFKKKHLTWWKMKFRNFTDVDSLKAFRYSIERTTFLIEYDEKRINEIVDELTGSNAWEIWKENETIVAEEFFDWF